MADDIASKDPPGEGSMPTFLVFQPYPLQIGQKIFIESGPRRGVWEVIGLSYRQVNLRCPFSGREVAWDRFCYLVEERQGLWPHPD